MSSSSGTIWLGDRWERESRGWRPLRRNEDIGSRLASVHTIPSSRRSHLPTIVDSPVGSQRARAGSRAPRFAVQERNNGGGGWRQNFLGLADHFRHPGRYESGFQSWDGRRRW
jgi:hypothetical protein